MASFMNNFATITHEEFKWPCPLDVRIIPSPPPRNPGQRLNLSRMDPDECKCDEHNIETSLSKYKKLAKKEHDLCKKITRVNQKMTELIDEMFENPVKSEDDVMKSVYQVAYERKNRFLNKYRPLMAAVDSPVPSPISPVIPELKSAYRDPTSFRYSLAEYPAIGAPEKIDFNREPKAFVMWTTPFTGRSEYMDTTSRLGLSNMKNQQQYLEPLPSSRRRWGDCGL